MRKALAVIAACLLFAGCSDSTSSEDPSTRQTPTPSACETTTAPTPSSEATPSSTSTAAEPTVEPSVDFLGQPLAGLPNCDWKDKDLWFNQYSDPNDEGEKAGLWSNSFALVNATGQNCVVRDVPTLTLIDSSGNVMWPANPQTQPDADLPWVLRDKFILRLYYYAPEPDTLCPQTTEQVETARFTFSDGTVIDYPMRESKYLMWTCPNGPTLPETTVHMNIAQ